MDDLRPTEIRKCNMTSFRITVEYSAAKICLAQIHAIQDLNFREIYVHCSAFNMLFSSEIFFIFFVFKPVLNHQWKSFGVTG